MILGCVLAGGQSRRFGSDKALAQIDGQSLIARAIGLLAGWCDHVVVVGREQAPAPTLPDWPRPGMGPLAGLAAALHCARDGAYDAVLSCGVDSLGLPENLPALLMPAGPPYPAAYVAAQPVVGLWPVAISPQLDTLLANVPPCIPQTLATQTLTSQTLASQTLASQTLASQTLATQTLATRALSMRALAQMVAARPVSLLHDAANINTPEDLAAFIAIQTGTITKHGEYARGL